jgi:GPH family glycoside/pentoside/hexuronide:cation symporter
LGATVAVERPLSWLAGLRYGALGLPLAFVALPLYVLLPDHYARQFGVPLALLGAVLLAARLLDAVIDPLLGRWVDTLLDRHPLRAWQVALGAATGAAAGFAALFFPPAPVAAALGPLMAWCALALTLAYLSYSFLMLTHQAWGTRLGGNESMRARIVAWREGLALVGVLVASVLPSAAGLLATTWVFVVTLGVGLVALRSGPRPDARQAEHTPTSPSSGPRDGGFATPLAQAPFRALLAVYLLNGIASAIPATLVLFFIRDQLQASAQEPLFLGSYFAAAALSIPLWVRAVGRFGLVAPWGAGMVLAVAVFIWAALLGPGDVAAYTAVCVLSGVALGADLTVPGTLLTGVIARAGHAQRLEGLYFGWWNFATKLNLALAAGLALPALQALGYTPGTRSEAGLSALTWAYCALPCALKLGAAALLWRSTRAGAALHDGTRNPTPAAAANTTVPHTP